jgi:hypothetical protein
MYEHQGLARTEDRRLGQASGLRSGCGRLQTRELRGEVGAGFAAEHGNGSRQRHGRGAKARETGEDGSGDPVGVHLRDAVGAGGRQRDPLGGERGKQLANQLGVPARRLMACRPEPGRRLGIQQRPDERIGALLAQRGQTQDGRCGLAVQRRQQLARRARLESTQPNGEHHGQAFESAGEIPDKAQRCRIGPVRIVDRDQQRGILGEIGGQPEESVQNRERRIAEPLRTRTRVPVRPPGRTAPGSRGPRHAPGVP